MYQGQLPFIEMLSFLNVVDESGHVRHWVDKPPLQVAHEWWQAGHTVVALE